MHKSNLTNGSTIEIKNFPTGTIKIETELIFSNRKITSENHQNLEFY